MDGEANETEQTPLQTDAAVAQPQETENVSAEAEQIVKSQAEQEVDAETTETGADEKSTRSKLPKVSIETDKRRGKVRLRRAVVLLLILVICLGGYVGINVWYSRTHYTIRFYQDDSQYVTGNVRIVFITDLHSRQYGNENEKLLSDITSLDPDLILLGGDMINRNDTDYTPVLDFCGKLSQIAPLYGVLGNHESERMYTQEEKDTELVDRFEQAGVSILRNESQMVRLGDGTIQLIGIEGTEAGFDKYGAKERMDEMEFRNDAYTIVMAHIPVLYKEKLIAYPFDLGLAGHVHGGIIRLPGAGGLYSDEEGFFPDLCRGVYKLKNGGKLIVSGGLGDSSALPRINNTPELVVVDVNWCGK